MKNNLLDEITVIIVLYKSTDIIFNSLKNLNNIKVIIVDNGGNDEILSRIKKKLKLIEIIKPKKNLGFGKASNLAFQKINTKYTLSLNPDSIIKEKDISSKKYNINTSSNKVKNISDNINKAKQNLQTTLIKADENNKHINDQKKEILDTSYTIAY